MIRFYGWDDGLYMTCSVCDLNERIGGDGAHQLALHSLVVLAAAHTDLHPVETYWGRGHDIKGIATEDVGVVLTCECGWKSQPRNWVHEVNALHDDHRIDALNRRPLTGPVARPG